MTREEDNNEEQSEQMLNHNHISSPAMEDRYYMTYFLFYGLGTMTLIPANFFTTATDYWMYKFRDPSNETYTINGSSSSSNRTELQAQFISNYSIVSNVGNVLFLILTIALIRKHLSVVQRMLGSLCGVTVMFVFTTGFVEIDTDSWQSGFYVMTMISGFCLTAFAAVFMVTLFEVVSKFPPGYLVPLLSGQSICGIFAALVQIFSLSIGASSQTTGLVYFLIAVFFVLLVLIYFLVILRKSEYFRYYLLKEEEQTQGPKITKEAIFSILNKIKYYMFSMIIVLGCSIMIHPGVTSLVESMEKGNGHKWNDVFYVPVITYLFYNVFDYVGRELAGKILKPKSGLVIFIAGICRVSLVPILMLCNAQPRHHLPVVFDKDYAYAIFIILLAFTNGYLMNLCVIHVPGVTEKEEKRIALLLIFSIMIISLGACSFISAALIKAL